LDGRIEELRDSYNTGQVDRAVELFSEMEFAWYSDGDKRFGDAAMDRRSLKEYMSERHRDGDRFSRLAVTSVESDTERAMVHFSGEIVRPSGEYPFKGAMDCEDGLFIAWSIGVPEGG
jgi:hypothetical protein